MAIRPSTIKMYMGVKVTENALYYKKQSPTENQWGL
jgi:hypothetical protein